MSLLVKNSNDIFVIKAFSFVLILNALKPWLDYFFTISHHVVTGVQFIFLLLIVTILNKHFYQRLNLFAFLLLLSITLRFTLETSMDLLEGDLVGIFSTSYFLIRILIIIYIFQITLAEEREINFYIYLRKIFIAYFVLTVVYTIFQTPYFFDIDYGDVLGYTESHDYLILSSKGGNVVSANHLGFFRASGGIGGTTLDYANYLLAVSWVVFFTKYKSKLLTYFLYFLFVWAAFICFSRALFLALFVMVFIFAVMPKKLYELLISLCVIFFLILFLLINIDSVLNFWTELAGNSDFKRIRSWTFNKS